MAKNDPLATVPLFASVPARERQRLASTMREVHRTSGESVLTEGEGGIGFFVILEGEAVVEVHGEEVRRLRAGQWAGEVALLSGDTRTATVKATSDLRALGLTAWEFTPLVKENPEVAWMLLVELAGRLREAQNR